MECHKIFSHRGQKARLDSGRIFPRWLGKRLFAFHKEVIEFVLFIMSAHSLGLYQTWLHRADVNEISSSRSSLPFGRRMSLGPTVMHVTITVLNLRLIRGIIHICSGCILIIFQSFSTMLKFTVH
jgi:hypothetical protein